MRLIEFDHQSEPLYYCHVTSIKNIDSIRSNGLIPNHNGGNYDDMRWTSLSGVYASKDAALLHKYLAAHNIVDFALVVIETKPDDVLPDEDIIDTNLGAAFEKSLSELRLGAHEIIEHVFDNDNEIDPSEEVWQRTIKYFMASAGPATTTVPPQEIVDLVDFWFAIEYCENSDALLDWGHMKDKFTRTHPKMVNVHLGHQHSVRVPHSITTEGSTRIVAILSCKLGTVEDIYNVVPDAAKATVSDLVMDIVSG